VQRASSTGITLEKTGKKVKTVANYSLMCARSVLYEADQEQRVFGAGRFSVETL
jgi:hypothetical protein